MRSLVRRHQQLSTEITDLDQVLDPLATAINPALLTANGVGTDAAEDGYRARPGRGRPSACRQGRDRSQHRLFCLVDADAVGARKPWLVVITGLSKPWQTVFPDTDYRRVRDLGDEYRSRNPRSVI